MDWDNLASECGGKMSKEVWKPGNMLYPLPVVMVSCADEQNKPNIVTVAWTGTICSDPAMVYVSVRPERHSYNMIKNSMEFVINMPTTEQTRITDWCGVKSGRDFDKFKEMGLTPKMGNLTYAPYIEECPVSLECKVTEIKKLGSHDMFIANIVDVLVDHERMDEKGKFHLNDAGLVAYSHGEYFELGEKIGKFGYSVAKR